MKKRIEYHIIIDDIIYFTTTRYSELLKTFDNVKRIEPKAWIRTCYS